MLDLNVVSTPAAKGDFYPCFTICDSPLYHVPQNRAWYGRLKHKGERERANATSGKPIIVVPAASSSIITIYNCKSFLQDTSFVPPAEARKAHKGPPPPLVEVEHTFSSGQTLKFEVCGDCLCSRCLDIAATCKADMFRD